MLGVQRLACRGATSLVPIILAGNPAAHWNGGNDGNPADAAEHGAIRKTRVLQTRTLRGGKALALSITCALLRPQSPGDFQSVTVHDERIGQDPFGGTIRLDFAPFENQDSAAQVRDEVQIVRSDNQRSVKDPQDLQQLTSRSWIQVAGRFIQHQN